MHVPPPRAPLPSVSGDTRAVGTYFARLEGKIDEAAVQAQQVAEGWAGAQDRLENLEDRLSQCVHGMATLQGEFSVFVSANARLVARLEANEAAVQTLAMGTDALTRLADSMRKRLTARSVLMASFAALGGGCGSVLAPQIVKFLGGLWHVLRIKNI